MALFVLRLCSGHDVTTADFPRNECAKVSSSYRKKQLSVYSFIFGGRFFRKKIKIPTSLTCPYSFRKFSEDGHKKYLYQASLAAVWLRDQTDNCHTVQHT